MRVWIGIGLMIAGAAVGTALDERARSNHRIDSARNAAQLEAVRTDLRNATDKLHDSAEDLNTCRASYTSCAEAVNACNGALQMTRMRGIRFQIPPPTGSQ